MERIAVIDYGMGNLRSVSRALQHVADDGQEVIVTSEVELIDGAERIVFPGQGAMRDCMKELSRLGLDAQIGGWIETRPFLGICMGLQVLLETSEEDAASPGIGFLKGRVRRFPAPIAGSESERLKVPHMGWNNIRLEGEPHPVWKGIEDGSRFYFVHSYYADPEERGLIAATTHYGVRFTSAVARGRLFAAQFHPEKSQDAGLRLLHNFLRWKPLPL